MTDTDEHIPRAARRKQRRRRHIRIAVAALAVALAIAGVALFVTDTLRIPGGDTTRVEPDGAAAATTPSDPAAPSTIAPSELPPPRPLSSEAPLRLWIGGDSLAGTLGPSLGNIAAATGVVQPQYDSRTSSGLIADPSGFKGWFTHAPEQMTELQPEVVVFIIGTNDFSAVPLGNDDRLAEWRTEYAQLTGRMMDILGDGGRRPVFWLGAPVLKEKRMNDAARVINEVMAQESRRHTDVTFVDTYEVFDDDEDGYTTTLPVGTNGRDVRVRVGDGVHLTAEGGDLLGAEVFKLLDARWKIEAQAVPGEPKPVIATKGSTYVPGTNRSPGTTSGSGGGSSGSGGSGGSSQTTAPTETTSAPDTTSPPSTSAPPTTAPPTSSPPTSSPPTT